MRGDTDGQCNNRMELAKKKTLDFLGYMNYINYRATKSEVIA